MTGKDIWVELQRQRPDVTELYNLINSTRTWRSMNNKAGIDYTDLHQGQMVAWITDVPDPPYNIIVGIVTSSDHTEACARIDSFCIGFRNCGDSAMIPPGAIVLNDIWTKRIHAQGFLTKAIA